MPTKAKDAKESPNQERRFQALSLPTSFTVVFRAETKYESRFHGFRYAPPVATGCHSFGVLSFARACQTGAESTEQ
jgi:hypothetical protein